MSPHVIRTIGVEKHNTFRIDFTQFSCVDVAFDSDLPLTDTRCSPLATATISSFPSPPHRARMIEYV